MREYQPEAQALHKIFGNREIQHAVAGWRQAALFLFIDEEGKIKPIRFKGSRFDPNATGFEFGKGFSRVTESYPNTCIFEKTTVKMKLIPVKFVQIEGAYPFAVAFCVRDDSFESLYF